MRDDVANSRKKVPCPGRNVLTVPMHAQRQAWPPPRLMPQCKDIKLQAAHAACRCCLPALSNFGCVCGCTSSESKRRPVYSTSAPPPDARSQEDRGFIDAITYQ